MPIKEIYQQAMIDEASFRRDTGLEKQDYVHILKNFHLPFPKKLTNEEKLFAILYANNYQLDEKKTGTLLEYSNAKRDGGRFLINAREALKKAQDASLAVPLRERPVQVTRPVAVKAPRKSTKFFHNVTISIGLDKDSSQILDPTLIVEHAQRRIDLFFYTLIFYYKTQLTLDIAPTILQHGTGLDKMSACHSSILPAIREKSDTRDNTCSFAEKNSILNETHFANSLNSTILLHQSVNYFDTHHLEGKEAQDKMRRKSIHILNEVAAGTYDPLTGILKFLIQLHTHFEEVKHKYFSCRDLPTSPTDTRALIFHSQAKGSFSATWHQNKVESKLDPRMNDEYVHTILRVKPEELDAIEKKHPEEQWEDYSVRFFSARQALYEKKYEAIAEEIKDSPRVPHT